MKTIILLIMLLFSVNVMQSQVRIGGISEAEKGAILDLSGTDYKGGLLLPKVEITDMSKIPAGFSDASVAGKPGVTALAGMLVWNTNPVAEGVYRWDGSKWNRLSTECNAAPSGTSISGFSGNHVLYMEFDVTCNATAYGLTLYMWTVPPGLTLVSGNGTSTVKLKAATPGVHPGSGISCAVTNACGSVTANSASDVTVVMPANLPLGSDTLRGRTCFDIAETEPDIYSGKLNIRSPKQADFTSLSQADKTYTFIAGGNVSNVRFAVVDTAGCVMSTSDLNPGQGTLSAGDSVTLTVNYKTTLNRADSNPLIYGRNRTEAAEVMIYAIYNNGTQDVYVPLRVTIQDGMCCGSFVGKGIWKGFMCHNLGADYTVDPFTPDYTTNGAYYQWGCRDKAKDAPASSGSDSTAITWNSATPSGYFGDNTDGENITVRSDYDPCPPGYRVPSVSEWNGVINTSLNTRTGAGSWTTSTNRTNIWGGHKFGEGLMLPAAGYRSSSAGTLGYRGYLGYYWTNSALSLSASNARRMDFSSSDMTMSNSYRTYGYSVRCIVE
jgi:uncharacterized protein (TIGR02145 family)